MEIKRERNREGNDVLLVDEDISREKRTARIRVVIVKPGTEFVVGDGENVVKNLGSYHYGYSDNYQRFAARKEGVRTMTKVFDSVLESTRKQSASAAFSDFKALLKTTADENAANKSDDLER